MENIQLRYVFDRRKVADNDTKRGLLQVEVRQTGTNNRILISTGIYLFKNQFSSRNGFTCRSHPNSPAITGAAVRVLRKIEAFALSDKCQCLDDVKFWNKDNVPHVKSVADFMRESLRQRDPAYTIVVQHNVLIRQIESFGRFKTFDDVTYVNVVDFDAFLRHTITSQPVIYKRHNTFKSYIVDAINRGLCKYSPYVQFKVPRGKSKTPVSPTIFMSSPSMGIGDKTRTIGIIIRGILSPSTITHVLKKVRRIAFITVWIIISIIII